MRVKRVFSKLETVRKRKGLSQGQFAMDELGISRVTYSQWLNEASEPPQEQVYKLLDYLREENYGPTFRDTGNTTVIKDGPDVFVFDDQKNGTHIVDPEETAELIQND